MPITEAFACTGTISEKTKDAATFTTDGPFSTLGIDSVRFRMNARQQAVIISTLFAQGIKISEQTRLGHVSNTQKF